MPYSRNEKDARVWIEMDGVLNCECHVVGYLLCHIVGVLGRKWKDEIYKYLVPHCRFSVIHTVGGLVLVPHSRSFLFFS